MAKAVIFDMGNVLIDWNPRAVYRPLFESEQEMERVVGSAILTMIDVVHDRDESFAECLAPLKAAEPDKAHIVEVFETRWHEFLRGHMPDSVEIVHELSERSVPLYGLSNWPHQVWPPRGAEGSDPADHDYSFLERFEDIVVSGQVKMRKPHRPIYDHALERFGLAPEDAVFVDDLQENIDTAERMGITGIRFTDAADLRARMRGLGLL